VVVQEGFRWRNDDGTEVTATWKENQDVNTSLELGQSARLRMLVDADVIPDPGVYPLYFKKTTDSTWTIVPVGSGGGSPVFIATSANIAASGEPTTPLLTPPDGKSTDFFSTGRMWDDENGVDTISLGGGFSFPASVSPNGRYFLDQFGNPLFLVGDTAWSMSAQIDDADSTLYLEDRAEKGFNLVVLSAPEHAFTDNSPFYENTYGQLPFTGTAFQSTLTDAYWDHIEFKVAEALRLGITMLICPQYLGFPSSDEGWNDEVVAATNAQMTTYGQALATRFASYPNVMWLIGHDRIPSATEMARSKAVADALQAGTSHLLTVGAGDNGLTGVENWSGSGISWDFDNGYRRSTLDYVAHTAGGYSNSPTIPFGFFEPLYEGDGASRAQCRYALYGPMCAGACYVFFGNHPIWHFGSSNWGGGGDWVAALDSGGSQDASRFATFIGTLNADWLETMVPDTTDTFLTGGEGSGTTQAAARFDGTTTTGIIALAYRPAGGSATLTFDLTELNQVSTVRVRKFDPTNGTYTTINTYATSLSAQAIGSLGNNAAGDSDWLLVFEVV
jgi:hypothetical protein